MPESPSQKSTKPPTVMRYERVQDIVSAEPVFRALLSPREKIVEKRNGEKVLFSKEVVEITDQIHAGGLDAHSVPRVNVLRLAAQVLNLGTPTVQVTEPVTAPTDAIPQQAQPDKSVPVPVPSQEVIQVPKPKKEKEKPKAKPQEEAPTPTVDTDSQRHYQVQSSIYSLILTALNLSISYETYPNADKRRAKLDALASEYGSTCNQVNPT